MIIIPAIIFSKSEGSILETLSKVGSYFVGAKLAMYGLGFFSKHTTERGLLWGVFSGFLVVCYVAIYTNIAWPWFCAIGAVTNIAVSWTMSLLLDGRQSQWSPYSVPGQWKKYELEGLAEQDAGWYTLSGKIDPISYVLGIFFILCIGFLYLFNLWI